MIAASLMSAFTPLADAHDATRFGGKAAGLARLVAAGCRVPPGLALAWNAVDALGDHDAAVLSGLLATGPVAVRSSAVGEDGMVASFAGQHRTVLGVRDLEGVRAAVRDVRASGSESSALEYRRRMGLDSAVRVGIVVQALVEADVAGVLFTRDPLGGEGAVLEASWGLGEVVVQGLVNPDRWRVAGAIEFTAGEKDLALRSVGDRVVEVSVDESDVARPCLSDAEVMAAVGIGRHLETVTPGPHDVELAWDRHGLWVLQWRPATR